MADKPNARKPAAGVKENEQHPDAAAHPIRLDAPNPILPAVDEDLERLKARGQTESQQQERAYYEGRFQTHEPTAHNLKRAKGDAIVRDAKE